MKQKEAAVCEMCLGKLVGRPRGDDALGSFFFNFLFLTYF